MEFDDGMGTAPPTAAVTATTAAMVSPTPVIEPASTTKAGEKFRQLVGELGKLKTTENQSQKLLAKADPLSTASQQAILKSNVQIGLQLPSGFRPATLDKLRTEHQRKLSSLLIPRMAPHQYGFQNFFADPKSGMVSGVTCVYDTR